MKISDKVAVYLDHSEAFLMELSDDVIIQKSVSSGFSHQDKEFSLSRSENLMHNKENQHQFAYFKKLGGMLLNYNDVVLFGPTNAKNELLNLLKADHRFDKIKIEAKDADKLDEYHRHAFVRQYFS
ncbi:MAG: hypothetical protein HXX13_03995 [Bacteroidetes bacterium]|nr:hypothetical protein [Bacteroidota bacterium]